MAYVGRAGATAPLTTADIPDNSITGAKIVAGTIEASDVAADMATQAELDTVSTVASAALPKAGGAMTGAITTNSTFDGVDIATRDAVLTSTTTTANAALPKAGGTMTGNIVMGDDTSIGIADNAERIEFDGAGDISVLGAKLGVGTDAPAADLHIYSASDHVRFNLDCADSTGDLWQFQSRNNGEFWIRNDDESINPIVILPSGNVGITGTLTIGADDTGHDVVFYGATSGKKMQWDESLDTLSLHSSILENSVSGSYRLHPDANTVGTCTYAFKDDNDTGMIRTGANAMGLVTGGTARLNIDSSGNVGIGTSVPAGRLHVHSTSGDGSLKISGDNIATSGGVLVGHSGGLLLQIAPSGGGTPVERVRFNHDGKVGIGVTPAAGALEVLEADDGDPAIRLYKSSNTNDSNQIFMEFVRGGNANGRIVGGGATAVAFATWSDERLKENIIDITGQLDLINKLRPVTFDWKSNGESSVGFIAQEFISILPEKVSTDQPTEEQIEAGETGTMAIAQWSSTDARIVAAIQELSAKVTALENA